MRLLCLLSWTAAAVFVAPPSRADTSTPALAFLTGASTFVTGFVVGGVLAATSRGNDAQENAGWLTTESGFVLAPLVSHAVAGEWTRAFVFAGPPAAGLAASATLLGIHPETIDHGELANQRVIWSLFGVGILSSLIGVIDTAFADNRAAAVTRAQPAAARAALPIAISPVVGGGQVGLRVGGWL